jgi:hypothetical protein
MHFALLDSKLPHVEEARSHYNDMLALDGRPPVTVRMISAIRAALGKLVH